jgi:hypothetical protein
MRSDKNIAINLRESGKSYNQISASLNIPKSTLSVWLKNLSLSDDAKSIIQSRVNSTAIKKLIERNKNQTVLAEERHKKIRILAKGEAKTLLSSPLFLSGVSLYWAEGYKQGANGSKWKCVDFANSDPDMIKLMIKFFIKFFKIKKSDINIQLMLHNPKNSVNTVNFWHKLTGVPKKNFMKTCSVLSRASLQKRNKTLQYGTIHLRVNNVEHFFRLIGWIDGLKQKLI